MCGKFTALASWADIVAFSQSPTADRGPAAENDREVAYRVMSVLPLIVWDPRQKRRRTLMARWGFPQAQDWKRPQPIHARAESIDTTQAFAGAFATGQRGIVLINTFNEAPDIPGPPIQHTITPEGPRGIAFVWRKFAVGTPDPLYACVMVTVPANRLIAALPTDRMPAVLVPEDWEIWLGEEPASPERIKACLKTVEGVNWKMEKERRSTPAASDPGGLF
ncbi:MAG TPA: SOS response-associated peptidase family protein [Rhizomicrobium sp.]|nr:SOS response-associated peptidase family protein [Rhizomicrobium sp.]